MLKNHFLVFFIFNLVLFLLVVPSLNKSRAQTCQYQPDSNNTITNTFNISDSGTYKVWSRILAPDASNNSFYLQIDNNCAVNVGDSPAIPANSFTWVDYQDGTTANTILLSLNSGIHTVKITQREAGIGVDKLLFTTNTQCIPVGTGDNCVESPTPTPTPVITGTATASSYLDNNNLPQYAFDGSITNLHGWGNNNSMPSWLAFDYGLGNNKIIKSYSIYCAGNQLGGWDNENYNPKTWTFQGWNGSSWVTLQNVSNGSLTRNQWKTFSFTNTNAYQKYRIYITAAEKGKWVHITELQLTP